MGRMQDMVVNVATLYQLLSLREWPPYVLHSPDTSKGLGCNKYLTQANGDIDKKKMRYLQTAYCIPCLLPTKNHHIIFRNVGGRFAGIVYGKFSQGEYACFCARWWPVLGCRLPLRVVARPSLSDGKSGLVCTNGRASTQCKRGTRLGGGQWTASSAAKSLSTAAKPSSALQSTTT